jgi:hypothetical protein
MSRSGKDASAERSEKDSKLPKLRAQTWSPVVSSHRGSPVMVHENPERYAGIEMFWMLGKGWFDDETNHPRHHATFLEALYFHVPTRPEESPSKLPKKGRRGSESQARKRRL